MKKFKIMVRKIIESEYEVYADSEDAAYDVAAELEQDGDDVVQAESSVSEIMAVEYYPLRAIEVVHASWRIDPEQYRATGCDIEAAYLAEDEVYSRTFAFGAHNNARRLLEQDIASYLSAISPKDVMEALDILAKHDFHMPEVYLEDGSIDVLEIKYGSALASIEKYEETKSFSGALEDWTGDPDSTLQTIAVPVGASFPTALAYFIDNITVLRAMHCFSIGQQMSSDFQDVLIKL